MADVMMRRDVARVQWGPAITGAFLAFAITIVLGLFGAAFGFGARSSGSQGLAVLSGVWVIVTPLVATFIGAAVAASLVGGRGAYLNGIMVWCLSLAYGALLLVLESLGAKGGQASAGISALAGLSAILGFLGALGGSAVGTAAEHRRERIAELRMPRRDRTYGTAYEQTTKAETTGPGAIPGAEEREPPELRH